MKPGKLEIKVEADVDPALREIRRLENAIKRASLLPRTSGWWFVLGLFSGAVVAYLSQLIEALS